MFSYTVHLPTVFLFLESLSFVKLFLTSGKGDIHLGSTVLVDENQYRVIIIRIARSRIPIMTGTFMRSTVLTFS